MGGLFYFKLGYRILNNICRMMKFNRKGVAKEIMNVE